MVGIIGVLLATVGIFFIAIPLSEISSFFSRTVILGNLLAFLSGFAWVAYSIGFEHVSHGKNPITVTTWTLSISAIILTIVMFSVDGWFSDTPHYSAILLTTFLELGYCITSFYFVVCNHPKSICTKSKRLPISNTNYCIIVGLVLGEIPTWWFGLGAVLILAGLIITQKS